MALTITTTNVKTGPNQRGGSFNPGLRTWVVDVTFDSSYATGGEAFDPASTYTGIMRSAPVFVLTEQIATYDVIYDRTNKKLMAYTKADGAQVASTTDLSAVTVRVMMWFN